jgi:hypothetical protein
MAQVTLYLDDSTAERLQLAAREAGMSQSKWVARLVQTKLASHWPREVLELAGTWPDFPTLDEIRANQGNDVPREPL